MNSKRSTQKKILSATAVLIIFVNLVQGASSLVIAHKKDRQYSLDRIIGTSFEIQKLSKPIEAGNLDPANKEILVVSMFQDLPNLPKHCKEKLSGSEVLNTFGYILNFSTPYDTGPVVIQKCSPIHWDDFDLVTSESGRRKLRMTDSGVEGQTSDWDFSVFKKKSRNGFKINT